MKILLVCNNFKPAWEGGGEVQTIYDLAQSLSRKGEDVTVYTTNFHSVDYGLPVNEPVVVDGITVYYFDNLMRRFPKISFPPLPLGLRRIVADNISSFDVIHINGHRNLLELIITKLAHKQEVPYVIQAHGSALRHDMRLLKTVFDRLFGDMIIKRAKLVIVSTLQEISDYRSIGAPATTFELAANGLDVSLFCDLPEKGKFRARYGITANERLILFLGRITEIKRIELLIEALKIIISLFSNVKLAIVGPMDDVAYMTFLNDLIREHDMEKHVIFTGPVYGPEKVEAYVDADVYVQPSRYESFSNTIIESLASGTPVVLSKYCNIADKIDGFGFTVEDSAEGFAHAIGNLLEDQNLRMTLGGEGREMVLEKFRWDEVVNDYIKIYRKVMNNK